jgi:putative SOS response-associated peptidase YedK
MCGRYVMAIPSEEVARLFGASCAPGVEERYEPSFNIPPTSQILALGESDDGGRILDLYRWGLVPSWVKDPASAPQMHNARAETVASKPAFSAAFTSRRVAVVAEGYYEWRRTPGSKLQPFYIHRADGAPLVFATLWESWMRDEYTLRSAAVITTAAGSDTEAVHDRMPVVLEADTLDLWLDRSEGDRDVLESLLRPSPRGTLITRPVDARVGKVAENDRGLLAAVVPDPEPAVAEPLTLF